MSIFDASNQQTTTTGGVAPWALPYAQDLLARTQQVANRPYTQSPGTYVGPGQGLQNAWQNAINTSQGGATQNPYAQYNNPELRNQIRAAQGDLASGWNNVQMPAWSKTMANSGSYGNTGVMQATDMAMGDLSKAMGKIGSDMRFGAYNTAANMAENFANRNDAFKQWGANAQMQVGNQMQGFNQAQQNQNQQWFNEAQNYPIQGLDQMRQSLGFGGTQSTQNAPGPSQAGQFLGGALTAAQIGKMFGWF